MDIVWGGSKAPEFNKALADWCAVQIGMPRTFQEPYVTMAVFEDTELVGVIVYNNWQPEAGTIEFHGAATTPRWLSRRVLKALFGYPFDQIGCQMVTTRVSERNTRLLRIYNALGFEHVVIPRLRGRDEGERIFFLTEENWRANKVHRKGRS